VFITKGSYGHSAYLRAGCDALGAIFADACDLCTAAFSVNALRSTGVSVCMKL
jgi:hypothetical protein